MKTYKKKVMVVDDDADSIDLILPALIKIYNVMPVTSGAAALEIVHDKENRPDIILLDIRMPEMDGYEVCRRLKQHPKTKSIPVIFVTALDEPEDEETGLNLGAADYITKPIKINIVKARIRAHLELKFYRDDLEQQVEIRTKEVIDLKEEIIETQKEIIERMGEIIETRSLETGSHIKRVSAIIYRLAKLAGLPEEEAVILKMAAPLHDVGKVAIPDHILTKPSKLSAEEFEKMKKHPELGYNIFKDSEREILKTTAIISYQHHERWNGTGYPRGLKGDNIHLYGRLASLADVFDALASPRVYKKTWERKEIEKEFRKQRGEQFDPLLTDLFIKHMDDFYEIQEIHKQGDQTEQTLF